MPSAVRAGERGPSAIITPSPGKPDKGKVATIKVWTSHAVADLRAIVRRYVMRRLSHRATTWSWMHRWREKDFISLLPRVHTTLLLGGQRTSASWARSLWVARNRVFLMVPSVVFSIPATV